MATGKLTLSIDLDTIEKAKQYAKEQQISLSKLIQRYLQNISVSEKRKPMIESEPELSDWIKQLTLTDKPTPDFDHKLEYGKYLEKKYSV